VFEILPGGRLMKDTTLFLIRHGETVSNVNGVWQGGQGDDPLNERGWAQSLAVATYLAQYLPIGALYTSDLRRAVETAEIIGKRLKLPVQMHAGLREYNFGALEGSTTAEVIAKWQALLDRWRTDPSVRPPGGESAIDFAMRVGGALQEIIAHHQAERVAVVAHGGSLSVGLAVLLGELDKWRAYQMSNCGVTIVTMSPSPTITTFDETFHLVDIGTAIWDGADASV
jgi:probable phosphoglycerate mutase